MMAIVEEHANDNHRKSGNTDDPAKETKFGIRAGLGYDIHVGKLSLTPTVNFDYIGKTSALVYGLGIGLGF